MERILLIFVKSKHSIHSKKQQTQIQVQKWLKHQK